jgi:WD40 repeat protein
MTDFVSNDIDSIKSVPLGEDINIESKQYKGHKKQINCLDINYHNENIIASGSDDKTIRIWDTRTNKTTKCIANCGFKSSIESLNFNVKNDYNLFASSGQDIFSFDLRMEGLILKEYVQMIDNLTDNNEINVMVSHRKGQYIAIADDSGTATVVDISTGRIEIESIKKQLSKVHKSIVSALAFRPNNNREIATGGFDCLSCSWDFSSGRALSTMNMTDNSLFSESNNASQVFNPPYIQALEYGCSGRVLIAALGDGSIRAIRPIGIYMYYLSIYLFSIYYKSHYLLSTFFYIDSSYLYNIEAHNGMATALRVSGNHVISGGVDKQIRGWQINEINVPGNNNGKSKGKATNGGGKYGVKILPLWNINHKEKINAIVCSRTEDSHPIYSKPFYIADVSSNITEYIVR